MADFTVGVAEPLPYTLLSLDRYAQIMGVNPVHFQGGYTSTVWPLTNSACGEIWTRYTWQLGDRVSHYDVAQAIALAEEQAAEYTNFPLAPMWVVDDEQPLPDGWSKSGSVRVYTKNEVSARYFRINELGRRAVRLIATASIAATTLEYIDLDDDGFDETAKITIPLTDETITDYRKVKLYVPGTLGEQEWEIRTPLRIVLDHINEELVIYIRSWLLVDPEKQSNYPSEDMFRALDVGNPVNLLSEVDIYYEYADPRYQVEILWRPGGCSYCQSLLDDCPYCEFHREWGCGHIVNADSGIIGIGLGTFSEEEGRWIPSNQAPSWNNKPDKVVLHYNAGYNGITRRTSGKIDLMAEQYAQAIAMLATARMNKSFCGCPSVTKKANFWQQNAAMSTRDETFFVNFEELRNPFGTRIGEMLAWNIIGKSPSHRRIKAAVL